jgi:hypothetical protein
MVEGFNKFKNGYQPGTIIVKEEMGDMFTDSPRYFGYVEQPFLSVTECTWGYCCYEDRSTYSRTNSV